MSFFDAIHRSDIQNVYRDKSQCISIDIKREDQIHPVVSGNKFRKLKYNIQQALSENHQVVLTYGGAYSNHIAATAAAAKMCGLQSIGIIRGQEIEDKLKVNPRHNPTLAFAKKQGMRLNFISRASYKKKQTTDEIKKLQQRFGSFYRIPEGGTNALAVRGCQEILSDNDKKYDIIACCVGTGGTLAGIINSTHKHQKVYGFSALKGHNHDEIKQWTKKDNWQIIQDNNFGGYAKSSPRLINFINSFYRCTSITLDPIYTGKMFYQLFKMIEEHQFKDNTKILAIHTGGLQAIKGFNQKQSDKNKPCLEF
ncbi:MAG: pyridoxal-phosphate dependent enzyme [Bacteroidetes bacterium]|jgi:1-aminocyclopropane-1-carboxylate deaminase|nr:pyridoxal-phosphate dependent enzyme [Bacteroidota bacterium]